MAEGITFGGVLAAGAAGLNILNTLFGMFGDDDDQPTYKPPTISPAKGEYEQSAIRFLADLYTQIGADLGFSYNEQGQLTYEPTESTRRLQERLQYHHGIFEREALGMGVPTQPRSQDQMAAELDELKRRRDALGPQIFGPQAKRDEPGPLSMYPPQEPIS